MQITICAVIGPTQSKGLRIITKLGIFSTAWKCLTKQLASSK